mgnify:CR=1 FL=1
MGRRLGEKTKNNTKCMVEVNGVKLIDRLLGQLSALDLTRVVIVVGYQRENLISYIGHRYDDRLHIEYVENPVYDRTNNIYSLALAKDKMMEDDTLLIESDLIFSDRLFTMILQNPHPNVAMVAKYEAWMDGTVVHVDADMNIVNFISKQAFSYDDVDKYYKTVNIYKFSRDFSRHKYVPFLEAYCQALGNNEYYEQVLRVITLLDGSDLKAQPVGDEPWYEIDDIQDLDIAETLFAEPDEMLRRFNYSWGGHWRFPKMLDYCYLVNPYFPPQRMKDELRAFFDTLLTEYPSGMKVNALLAGKNFGLRPSRIIVGNGAAELIKSLMEHVARQPVGIIYPTFEEYPHRLRTEDIVDYHAADDDLAYSVDDLMAFYGDKDIRQLLLVNPDNPSGNFIPKADVLRLAGWCEERDVRLIVDESFVDFSDDFGQNTLLDDDLLGVHPNLVVVKSISKSYGVPGLRLGILASADEALIDWMKHDVSIWNINSFAEYYMQIYGKYEKDYAKACRRFIAERRRFRQQLSQVSFLQVLPTQANFFCCKVTGRFTSAELERRLLVEHHIIIKNCDSKTTLEGRNMIRLSIRNEDDNDRLIRALKALEAE